MDTDQVRLGLGLIPAVDEMVMTLPPRPCFLKKGTRTFVETKTDSTFILKTFVNSCEVTVCDGCFEYVRDREFTNVRNWQMGKGKRVSQSSNVNIDLCNISPTSLAFPGSRSAVGSRRNEEVGQGPFTYIVDDDIETAKLGLSELDRLLPGLFLGHVALHKLDSCLGLLCSVKIDVCSCERQFVENLDEYKKSLFARTDNLGTIGHKLGDDPCAKALGSSGDLIRFPKSEWREEERKCQTYNGDFVGESSVRHGVAVGFSRCLELVRPGERCLANR
jgi:hypothetical protein